MAQVRDLINACTSASDVGRSKPDPDLILAALRAGQLRPEEAVMVGDTPYDLHAARGAGVAAIALRCGGWSDPDHSEAIAIYDDPAHLLATYEVSPLAASQVADVPATGNPRASSTCPP